MADKEALYDEGLDLAFEGRFEEAMARYHEALAIDPDYSDAVHALAMVLADSDRLDEAIEWGKRLCELTPNDVLAHTSLSTFYQRKGLIPEAEAAGAKARMLDWKRQLAGEPEKT